MDILLSYAIIVLILTLNMIVMMAQRYQLGPYTMDRQFQRYMTVMSLLR